MTNVEQSEVFIDGERMVRMRLTVGVELAQAINELVRKHKPKTVEVKSTKKDAEPSE